MPTLPRKMRRPLRLALTALATLCLFASFARPLQAVEVWRFRTQSHDPPQILAFNGTKPRYRDNAKVEVLAFFPQIGHAAVWKFDLLLFAFGLSSVLTGFGIREIRSPDPLQRIKDRWNHLTDEERQSLKADLTALLAFMDGQGGQGTNASSSGDRVHGEEPHVTSERLRQAQALVSEGMEEREAVARVWQIASGSPAHDQRLGVYRRWLQE